MGEFFEPLSAMKSRLWELEFRNPPWRDEPDEREAARLEWEWEKKRAAKDADVLIFGSNMSPEGETVVSLLGTQSRSSGREIVATLRKSHAWPDDGPTHDEVARRIADCTNALAGIPDPQGFMDEVRALLNEITRIRPDSQRARRLVGMLARGDCP